MRHFLFIVTLLLLVSPLAFGQEPGSGYGSSEVEETTNMKETTG